MKEELKKIIRNKNELIKYLNDNLLDFFNASIINECVCFKGGNNFKIKILC